jgi:hypothetical protein
VPVFRFQDQAIHLPDTRNLTPLNCAIAAPLGPLSPGVVSKKT